MIQPSANPCCIATQRQVERLKEEISGVRRMFDVTRHRVCDALGQEHGKSWSSLESEAARLRSSNAALLEALKEISSTFPGDDETPQDYRKRLQHSARAAIEAAGMEGT